METYLFIFILLRLFLSSLFLLLLLNFIDYFLQRIVIQHLQTTDQLTEGQRNLDHIYCCRWDNFQQPSTFPSPSFNIIFQEGTFPSRFLRYLVTLRTYSIECTSERSRMLCFLDFLRDRQPILASRDHRKLTVEDFLQFNSRVKKMLKHHGQSILLFLWRFRLFWRTVPIYLQRSRKLNQNTPMRFCRPLHFNHHILIKF